MNEGLVGNVKLAIPGRASHLIVLPIGLPMKNLVA